MHPSGTLDTWRTCMHPCSLLYHNTYCIPCLEQGYASFFYQHAVMLLVGCQPHLPKQGNWH